MTNHYFIGIGVPEEQALTIQAERDSWGLDSSYKVVVPHEDMHLTLIYIGSDRHGELDSVLGSLEKISHQSFDVEVDGVGTFGNPATPRVIYAHVSPNNALAVLQRKVKEALAGYQLKPDDRPFVPHITLAKKWKGGTALSGDKQLSAVSFKANSFALYKVNLVKRPRYEAVRVYPLGAGG